MTEKELQEIEDQFNWGVKAAGEGQGYTNLDDESVLKLIATVRRLQDALKGSAIITKTARSQIKRLEEQNSVYAQVLQIIANGEMSETNETPREEYMHESYYILVALAQKALDQAKGAVEGERD